VDRVGIMGGTFNPIHFAHLILAEMAREQHGLDRVMFLPSKKPAHKSIQALADDHHRYKMTELAIMGNDAFFVSDIELRREGNTYTIDTLRHLAENNADTEYYYIIGGDPLLYFDEWKCADQIVGLCRLITSDRAGCDTDEVKDKINKLNKELNTDIMYADIPRIDISSSMIRERIGLGRTVKYLLPDLVGEYIVKYGLYLT